MLSECLPVGAGVELPLLEDFLDLGIIRGHLLSVIAVRLKGLVIPAQISQSIYHLAERLIVIGRIVLDDLLVFAPCGKIFVAHETVIRQVARAAVAEAHHRVLLKLVDRARIDAFVQVVFPRRIVAECDPSLCEGSLGVPACFAVPACLAVAGGFRREQLEKPVVRVVDDLGRRPGKILMRPRIRQDMHSDAGGLEAFVFGQIYCLHQKVAVGAADESIFCLIDARALLRVRFQVFGQEMEGSPDPRNILKPKKVRAGVHHLQLQLCGGRFGRPADGGEQGSRAAVRKLGAVTDRKTLLVGIPCQKGRAICRIIMKVNLHFVFSFPEFVAAVLFRLRRNYAAQCFACQKSPL